MPHGWGLYSTTGNHYRRMRQVGTYITYPLSHFCRHAHKCACAHTHTHPHTLIHITHTHQQQYHGPPLMPPRIFLRVTTSINGYYGSLIGEFMQGYFLRYLANFLSMKQELALVCRRDKT